MNVRLLFVSTVLTVLGASFPAASAHAAPQLLGVVASAEPVPMTCEGGVCTAELSAFCLEQGRSGPQDGTAYRAIDPRPVTLVAIAADGSARRMPATSSLKFASARGYSAVTASVPESMREGLGAARLAIAVGPMLTLAPLPVAGDPHPLTDKEIAEASGSLRAIAANLFEPDNQPEMVTAQALNRLINALPQSAGREAIDLVSREGLWSQAVGGAPRVDDTDPGMAQAALVFESCRRGAHYVQGLTLRRCLEASHDALMSSLNLQYWQVVGAGS